MGSMRRLSYFPFLFAVLTGCASGSVEDTRCPASAATSAACAKDLKKTGLGASSGRQVQPEAGSDTDASSDKSDPSNQKCETAVTGVNLIDLETRKILANVDVSMGGGRITAIRKHRDEKPECKKTVDGRDKFMMPGLVDMHTHADAVFLPRANGYVKINNFIPLTLQQAGKMLLTAGVTAFLDLCSAPQDEILGMRDRQRSSGLPFDMPDIYSAGSCITSKWFDKEGDPAQYNRQKQIVDVTFLEKGTITIAHILLKVSGTSKP